MALPMSLPVTGFQLRDARPADLPRLLELEAMFPGDRLSARQFRHHLGSPRARLRVLENDGIVLGYALLLTRADSRIARLYSIAVDPQARGTGAGQRLLQDAFIQARQAGCQRLRLEVRCDNEAAIALYLKAGCHRIGVRPGYYTDGCDALRMECVLAAPAVA